jgi:hypothetical protein
LRPCGALAVAAIVPGGSSDVPRLTAVGAVAVGDVHGLVVELVLVRQCHRVPASGCRGRAGPAWWLLPAVVFWS